MRFSTTAWQVVAIVLAAATLVLQIFLGLEHLEGASSATKASIVLVMVTLAVLPKIIEVAAGNRMYALTGVLLLAFGSWLAYSLPATVGRTGEVKEARIAEVKASGEGRKLLTLELERARARLDMAESDVKRLCKNPYSDNCTSARLVERERQARVDQLLAEMVERKAAPVGDVASDLLAWALSSVGLTADAIRKGSVLAFALGLDVLIWALVWFGTTDRIRTRKEAPAAGTSIDAAPVSASPSPPDGGQKVARILSDEDRLADIRREVSAGRHHGVVEYGVRWGLSKSEASKTISSLQEAGEITCSNVGRQKLVTGIKRHLTRAA